MSPGIKETNGLSLPEAYKASLQQHIEQGGWSLVCRDEELCNHVEDILRGHSAHESYLTFGLDVLAVIEESLLCPATARAGLKGLSRAFEVLELASLNLYLYPWRKEYRVIKTYSGMFTHYIRPALSMMQVTELFRLLGYHISRGVSGEEELRLGTSPMLADDLLRLACSFFIARCECQLLLSTLKPSSRPLARVSEWELRLVQECRKGHSLQVALQSVQRSLGSPLRSVKEICCDSMNETDEDLYTGEGEGGSSSPVEVPIQGRGSHRPLKQANSSSVLITSGAASSQTSRLCVSTLSYQLSSPTSPGAGARPEQLSGLEEPLFQRPGNSVSQKGLKRCTCVESNTHYIICLQCNMLHCLSCAILDHCRELRHDVSYRGDSDLPEERELSKTTHILSPKDKRSPPGFPERHFCLVGTNKPHITCHTCHLAHDCLCDEVHDCAEASHEVEYQLELNQSMAFHECCDTLHPLFACLKCRVFHSAKCCDGDCCKEEHDVHMLANICKMEGCSRHPQVLCRHCCAQLCRECWYKNPLQCLCGKPLDPIQCSAV